MEALLGNANALCKELSEQNAVISSKVEALQADQKSKEEDVVGVANEQCIEMPTSENPPDWEASPIKHTANPIQDTTFSADDTFDESMFLPNVHDDLKSPQTDENKTPPTPITSNKRVLFSPSGEEIANVKAAAKSATPVQRMTRSMRNKGRTPLGKSAVQNASSTTRKSRAKRQKSDD